MSTAPNLQDTQLEIHGRIAVLTLNRDDMRNALTGNNMIEEIEEVCAWINQTPSISVMVLTGAGKAFSAGGNVKEMADREGSFAGDAAELADTYRYGIQRIPKAIRSLDVPSIAAVNGAAIGAGCDLTAMCDMRIASEKALFGETFVNLGIIPGDGGAWFLTRLLGEQRAADMMFTGRLVDAAEAKEIGLVLEVVPHDELMDKAMELAGTIAGKPPHALRYAKRLLKQATKQELPDFLDQCAQFQGLCHQFEDHHEAVAAFLEKREPVFKGK